MLDDPPVRFLEEVCPNFREGNPRANQIKLVKEWMVEKRGIIESMPRSGKCNVGSTILNGNFGFLSMREVIDRKGYNRVSGLTVDRD